MNDAQVDTGELSPEWWEARYVELGRVVKVFYLLFGAAGLTELLGVRVEPGRSNFPGLGLAGMVGDEPE